ncbi:family 1 glycosylhydrolase [Aquihabitans sp. McL0605]|uniref:family 1 glycosylhydrolase n=1 Tax=Aquihabitans sp. McL0605 TaxID=3415671 RepID=UPI003CF89835
MTGATPPNPVVDFPAFAVSCGEEGSDPLVLHEGRTVRVDEYRASGHLEHLDRDLADVAALGVQVWRYGMPWRLAEPAPGVYDWALWDRALDACRRHDLIPVIDLCHFGLPDHYGGFCEPDWVEGFGRYVDAFLARYPEPVWFTPVNEPGITALFSARLGMWNDRRATEDDYFVALANIVTANLEALRRIRADRDGWWIGSEGFGCELADPADEGGIRAATDARDLQQLVWDLHLGVAPRGVGARFTDVATEAVQERITGLVGVVPADRIIAGHDIYPVSVAPHGTMAARPLSIGDRVAAYEAEATAWFDRYRVPFWVSETSNLGLPVEQGTEWLEALTASLATMTRRGLPVRGICWYSRGDQFDWDTALTVPIGTVTEVGLFDADRRARPVAQAYAALAARGRA